MLFNKLVSSFFKKTKTSTVHVGTKILENVTCLQVTFSLITYFHATVYCVVTQHSFPREERCATTQRTAAKETISDTARDILFKISSTGRFRTNTRTF